MFKKKVINKRKSSVNEKYTSVSEIVSISQKRFYNDTGIYLELKDLKILLYIFLNTIFEFSKYKTVSILELMKIRFSFDTQRFSITISKKLKSNMKEDLFLNEKLLSKSSIIKELKKKEEIDYSIQKNKIKNELLTSPFFNEALRMKIEDSKFESKFDFLS